MFPQVKFSMFVDRPHVMRRIERKRLRVLTQTGAFARTVMKRSIRAPKRGKRARTVVVDGRQYLVPVAGRVLDLATMRACTAEQAKAARLAMAGRLRSEGEGKPPRRGPSDRLRQEIFFGVDQDSETVVIGPRIYASQPTLVGAKSVPELLEKGGIEVIFGKRVRYGARPYVAPILPVAQKKMAELVERIQL
jgi:hypothetical protein